MGIERSLIVLVADDSVELALRLTGAIRTIEGVEVLGPAFDGDEALVLAREHRPDVAVLDVRMPRKNGLEVAEAMRAAGLPRHLAFFTSTTEGSVRDRAMALGADALFVKPYDLERMLLWIEKLRDAARVGNVPTDPSESSD